jgi:hypothetical protein
MPDTNLEGDHPRIISAKLGWDLLSSFRGEEFFFNFIPLFFHRTLWEIPIKIFLSETICSIRTKFWWNSHWMALFQKCVRRFGPSTKMAPTAELSLTYMTLWEIHIKIFLSRTSWKRAIQWLFHQNLVLIEQMVSDKKIFMGISHRVLC